LWEELKNQNLVLRGHRQLYIEMLNQAYGAGYDEGRKQGSHQKKVAQYDQYNNLIRVFDSCLDAARAADVHKTHISKACLGKTNNVKGYYYKYITP